MQLLLHYTTAGVNIARTHCEWRVNETCPALHLVLLTLCWCQDANGKEPAAPVCSEQSLLLYNWLTSTGTEQTGRFQNGERQDLIYLDMKAS